MEMNTGTETIIKKVVLPVGWELDDEAGLKTYLHELYHVNDCISGLFDDNNLRVVTMKTTVEIEVEQVEIDLGTIDPTPLD